jgi:alkylation response protein AidB-like acyl-CoA dehydrogenase
VPETAQAFRLTEDQILLRDAVRTLADEQIRPRAAEIDKKAEFPHDVKDLLARQDIFGLPFSEEYGGVGADLLTTCIAIEELSRVDATSGLILAVQELAALPIVLVGTDDQKRTWLPDIAAGRKLIAFALTESAAGSDPTATKTRAIRSDDGSRYTLDGSKRFISHASVADLLIVFAVSNPDAQKPSRRMSAFVVETATPGFRVERLEHKMGIRGSPTAELSFDGVSVPAENRLGEEGEGFAIAMRTFERSRPGIAAQAVGIAQGALDEATRYSRERIQFGSPIGELQMIQALLADMAAQTEAARALLYRACAEIEHGPAEDAARWAAMCKLIAGDTAMRVATDAVQVLGGYGYIEDFPVERMMRDAKITQLYEGTQQIQRLVIARALLRTRT